MKKQTRKFKEVCVVGAGPAGSLSAYLLSLSGFRVTIIDRYSNVKRKVCGEYLCPLGTSLIANLGLENLVKGFEPVYGMKIVSPSSLPVLTFFPEKEGMSHGLSVNRKVFDERLRSLLNQKVDRFIVGESVNKIERIGNRWRVMTDSFCREFDLVVAADGINSSIAQRLSHKEKIFTDRVALHAYIKLKDPKAYSRLGQMHIFNDGSYAGVNPINEDEVNFSIVCNKEALKGRELHEVINSYISNSRELEAIFGLVSSSDQVKTAGSLKNKNTHIAGDGIVYVGDSAGFIDPLTGEGIYNALQSAKILNDCLKVSPDEDGLAQYKKLRVSLFREKNILNSIFQFIIKSKYLCNLVARFLLGKQFRADTFVGVIGNIYTPLEGLLKLIKN